MRIRPNELERRLAQGLAPIYLLSGDEPLQMNEAADTIRAAARAAGYSEREVLDVGTGFDWSELANQAASMSLFGDQRLIDLRIPSGKPGRDGGAALADYAANPPADCLLLISLPRLDRNQQNSKWFKALDKAGAVVQIWPVDAGRLTGWLAQRMKQHGLSADPQALRLLADRIEGNLLAGAQEIEKLALLHGPGQISTEQMAASVADSARFDVFGLADAALAGDLSRARRMLAGLRAEGTAAPVALWALARDLRTLNQLADAQQRGQPSAPLMTRLQVFDKRKPLIGKALKRLSAARCRQLLVECQRADLAIKGRDRNDPWLLLDRILVGMAGIASPRLAG